MSVQVDSKKDFKVLAKWLVIVLVPLAIYLLPISENFTLSIKLFFVVTAFGILTFVLEPFDYAIGALLMMSGYVLTGLSPMASVFKPFTQSIPWMVFGCLLLINVIQSRSTLIERIACFCMIKTGGTYKGIIYGLIILGILINVIVPGVFTCMAIAVLAYGICNALDLGKSKASSGIMLAGIIGFIEAWSFVYCPPDLGVLLGIASAVTPLPMDYLTYFKHCLIYLPFPFLMGFAITKICKPEKEINGKAYFMERRAALGGLSKEEKKIMVVLMVFVLYLFTFQWHQMDMMWGFLFAPLALYLPGLNVGRKEDLSGVSFPMILFVVGCMSIGVVATEVGVAQMISDAALPLLSGKSNAFFVLFVYVFTVAFNFVMTPMALMAAFSVPMTQIAVDMGMSPYPMLYAFSRGCYNILLPYEAVIIAAFFAFGNTQISCFLKCFGLKIILTGLWIFFIACPYWTLLGLMG